MTRVHLMSSRPNALLTQVLPLLQRLFLSGGVLVIDSRYELLRLLVGLLVRIYTEQYMCHAILNDLLSHCEAHLRPAQYMRPDDCPTRIWPLAMRGFGAR